MDDKQAEASSANLRGMIEIAERAIEFRKAERIAAMEKEDYRAALKDYKRRAGVGSFVERDSPAYNAMLEATAGEYIAAEKVKAEAYNAKRRLRSAVDKLNAR